MNVLRVLKVKLYPNRTQASVLEKFIDVSRLVYNQAIEQRTHAVRPDGKGLTLYDQNKQLTLQRAANKEMASIPLEVERDGLRRADVAFQNFFRKCREGAKKKGFPRYKAPTRYNSFTNTEPGYCIRNGMIKVTGIKSPIRCRGLQPFTEMPKRLTILRRGRSWFARILVDDKQPMPGKKPAEHRVGIDVGLNSFITTTDGLKVDCPKHSRRLSDRLRRASRKLSRCKRGSKRRKRAIIRLQSVHAKITDRRDNFTHQLSRKIVNQYDFIAAEKLNIAGMLRGRLAKSITDAGWGTFLNRIAYKAERAGCTFIQVEPRGTSQECSQCGTIVKKELSERTHECSCGLVIDRDENAARNILRRAMLSAPRSGNERVIDGEDQPLHQPLLVDASQSVETSSPSLDITADSLEACP